MKPKLCIVKWRDAHFVSDEVSVEDSNKRHKSAYYWSAGILVKSDDQGVTLAMDYGLPIEDTDGHAWRTRSFIPRELIEIEMLAGQLIRTKRPPAPVSKITDVGPEPNR